MNVVETPRAIEIRSAMPAGARVLYLLLALIPWLAPYELIIQPDWQSYLNLPFLFVGLISLGAVTVSALLVWAAVAGLSSRLRFDRSLRLFSYSAGAPLVPWRTSHVPLREIDRIEVAERTWSDGAPTYSLLVSVSDGREFESGSSWSKEELEEIRSQVARKIDR